MILTSHLGTHQLYTTVKEKVYLKIISKNHATTTLCLKLSFVLLLKVVQRHFLYMHATEPFKFAYSCAHSEHEKIHVVMTYECLNLGILSKYTPISITVALGFGH